MTALKTHSEMKSPLTLIAKIKQRRQATFWGGAQVFSSTYNSSLVSAFNNKHRANFLLSLQCELLVTHLDIPLGLQHPVSFG